MFFNVNLITMYAIFYFILDLIDIVKDQLYGADYIKEEDPKLYVSEKTNRGPLSENWISEYWKECQVIKITI